MNVFYSVLEDRRQLIVWFGQGTTVQSLAEGLRQAKLMAPMSEDSLKAAQDERLLRQAAADAAQSMHLSAESGALIGQEQGAVDVAGIGLHYLLVEEAADPARVRPEEPEAVHIYQLDLAEIDLYGFRWVRHAGHLIKRAHEQGRPPNLDQALGKGPLQSSA
jgi:hypothetical protein